MLNTFVVVYQGKIISPYLVTIREYGRWFESIFDEYTTQMELYLKSKKSGDTLLEWHPGTRIGNWFDSQEFQKEDLKCWYINQESKAMEKLIKHNLAEYRDSIPLKEEGKRALRIYTVEMIELYLRSNLDKNFKMSSFVKNPLQVRVKTLDGLTIPKVVKKKSLF